MSQTPAHDFRGEIKPEIRRSLEDSFCFLTNIIASSKDSENTLDSRLNTFFFLLLRSTCFSNICQMIFKKNNSAFSFLGL